MSVERSCLLSGCQVRVGGGEGLTCTACSRRRTKDRQPGRQDRALESERGRYRYQQKVKKSVAEANWLKKQDLRRKARQEAEAEASDLYEVRWCWRCGSSTRRPN